MEQKEEEEGEEEEAEEKAVRAGLSFPSARDMVLSEAFRRLSAEMVRKGGKNVGGESEGIERRFDRETVKEVGW